MSEYDSSMPKAPRCSVVGCEREPWAKGECQAHYRRHLRAKTNGGSRLGDRPVLDRERGDLHDVSTRVDEETRSALEAAGGVYAVAGDILTAWAKGKRLPRRASKAA